MWPKESKIETLQNGVRSMQPLKIIMLATIQYINDEKKILPNTVSANTILYGFVAVECMSYSAEHGRVKVLKCGVRS